MYTIHADRVALEEAGQGLRTLLADLGVGAEGKPGLGHALEAAERAVGYPRQDLDEGAFGEAPQGLLLLSLLLPHLGGGERRSKLDGWRRRVSPHGEPGLEGFGKWKRVTERHRNIGLAILLP